VLLRIPPLRERREDLPELIDVLFKRARERHGLVHSRLSGSLLQRLISYSWPGNVRQLENVIERLLVLSPDDLLTEENLPEELQPATLSNTSPLQFPLPEGGISLEAVERELITQALARFDGNQTHAARYLDISRRTLIYRIEKYGLLQEDGAN
jgi:two-component system NtrC family response regulator